MGKKKQNGAGIHEGAANGAVIHMREIRKIYDTGKIKVEALRGIDIDVKPGEFIAIVGPSGSGKSTLMNLIGCLDTPTDGLYQLRGEEVAGMKRDQLADIRNRRVGFVFQNFNLLPQITAYENVEMPLLFGSIGRKKRRERVEELFERVGLADRMEHKPTELSGGQMQRVAVARALAMNPDIVLADEPTGNLDTASGGDIMGLFAELWEQGTTMVVITHDKALAKRAERQVELVDGLITADSGGGEPRMKTCRYCAEEIQDEAIKCKHCGEFLDGRPQVHPAYAGYEYRSEMEIAGWPLVHVAHGIDPETGRPRVARGVIAIGNIALGVISIGGIAAGVFSLGGLSLGLLAFGGVALGGVAAGGLAVATTLALGGAAFSLKYAIGGLAVAPFTIGPEGVDPEVVEAVKGWLGAGES